MPPPVDAPERACEVGIDETNSDIFHEHGALIQFPLSRTGTSSLLTVRRMTYSTVTCMYSLLTALALDSRKVCSAKSSRSVFYPAVARVQTMLCIVGRADVSNRDLAQGRANVRR